VVVLALLILGLVLLAIEMRHLAFYALFGAAGSFAAALVAVFLPSAIPLQIAVAVVVAAIGIIAIRPMVSEAVHRRYQGRLGRGVHGSLIGEEVLALDIIGDAHQVGHVKLVGERWLAVSGSGTPIPPGTKVLVTAVQGTTLTVWPVDGAGHPVIDLSPASEADAGPSIQAPPDGAEGEHQ